MSTINIFYDLTARMAQYFFGNTSTMNACQGEARAHALGPGLGPPSLIADNVYGCRDFGATRFSFTCPAGSGDAGVRLARYPHRRRIWFVSGLSRLVGGTCSRRRNDFAAETYTLAEMSEGRSAA